MPDPYHRFRSEELIVRDLLAVDRTELANERTLLSWVRTALALVLAGASSIHFIGTASAIAVGIGLIALGAAAIPVGVVRWARLQRIISRIKSGSLPLDGKPSDAARQRDSTPPPQKA